MLICSLPHCELMSPRQHASHVNRSRWPYSERLCTKWRRPKGLLSPHTKYKLSSWLPWWKMANNTRKPHLQSEKPSFFFCIYNPSIYLNIMLRGASVVRNTARLTVGKSSRLYTVRCHGYSLSNSLLMLLIHHHNSPSDFTPAPPAPPLQSKKRRLDQLERSSCGPLF